MQCKPMRIYTRCNLRILIEHRAKNWSTCLGVKHACIWQVAEMEQLRLDLGASQNQCLFLEKQLEDLKEDVKTVLNVSPAAQISHPP
eukprot:scaffold237756_cov35-Prasinocladus_malaysianus.AAC.1